MNKYIKHQAPILPVHDLGKTLDYYRDRLGFEVAWVWEEDYASVVNREIEIHFTKSDTVTPHSIYLFVENAGEVYEFLREQQVEIADPLTSKPWGMKEFTIRDINGHLFRIGHGEKSIDEIDSFNRWLF